MNAKMCFAIENKNCDDTLINNSTLKIIGSDFILAKPFICTCFIYNIDILERKLIILSEKLKQVKGCFTLLRNSFLDKSIEIDKASRLDILSNSNRVDEIYYYTRNKYAINIA
jgi:hypothetical protein